MTIEDDIIAWGLGRPGWQQDVLADLANGEQYGPTRIIDLVDKMLAGRNNAPNGKAKCIHVKSAVTKQVNLVSITDLCGVNALVNGQSLGFATTGITVVYGDNGSGKSGYARLIKAMVKARHRSDVLPNVFRGSSGEPSATLHYCVASKEQAVSFPSVPPPELLKVGFYDEYCGDEYLAKESTISYRPSILILLDGLIRVCDDIRSEITTRINLNESKSLTLDLPPTTEAGIFLKTLAANTTEAQIDAASELAEDAHEQLSAVIQEEVRLSATDPQKEKTRVTRLSNQVKTLSADLGLLIDAVGVEKTAIRANLRAAAIAARAAASVAAESSFDDESLAGVGSETWRLLWGAARNYSVNEAYRGEEFPVIGEGAMCVLCQQPLDNEAKARLQRFDRYMTDITERDAATAEQSFDATLRELQELEFATSFRAAALTALQAQDPQLASAIADLLAQLEKQRDVVIQYLTNEAPAPEPLTNSGVPAKLDSLAMLLQGQADATDTEQFRTLTTTLSNREAELRAHIRLSESSAKVKTEVHRLRQLEELRRAFTAAETGSITQKASTLTREYATKRILNHFTSEAEGLRLQNVTLQDLGGRKGKLNQKPGLLGADKRVVTSTVLSEGEQTALGLAGFFTEAVFDPSSSALVFDDPVTSLDHVRRDKVAERLAQLAQDRQVVVFTHDVAFTGDLAAAAQREDVVLTERAVERRGAEPGICIETFPWKAKDFKSRTAHLREELTRLSSERASLVQDEWEERVATWAGYLSETWERSVTTEVMNQVFDRGSSEVRMMKFRLLAKITDDDNTDVQEGYGATSRWARRHDKAVEKNYVAPEPEDLKKELVRLVNWQKRVRKYL